MKSSKLKVKSFELGQSLIEVLIALAASVAVVSAIAVTVITSLQNAEFTKNQNLATQYSREGMEIIRQIAKNNWSNFLTYTNRDYCLNKDSTSLSPMTGLNCQLNINTGNSVFDRKITIIQLGSVPASVYCTNSAEVLSSVSWTDSKCQTGNILCHEIKLRSCLADVNSVKGP